MYLISPEKKQYKANLHCHSNLSDGKRTPEQLKEMYKGHGYSILSITDHEYPCNHSDLNDEEFITITGYEAYIRPGHKYNVYGKEVHINLFARDPENTSYVCYNPIYCKYMPLPKQLAAKKVGSQEERRFTVEYINKFVRNAKENGYICTYNHPWWSMENEETILQYEGFFSMEMCNYSSYLIARLEYNAALYDKMILAGKKIFCHSTDDNHNGSPDDSPACDSYGGFTMIMPEEFTYDSIYSAMEQGEMYSSMGPLFKEVSVEDGKLHVECSEVERITVFYGSKKPSRVLAPIGETVTSADFTIDPKAKFVRVSVSDSRGRFADTRAFSREEVGLPEEE